MWCALRDMRRLELLLKREADKYRAMDNVIGIGVLGSMARKDVWECSDLDLVVLFEKAENDFFFEFDDQDGIPIDVMCITKNYLKDQPYVSSLYGCRVMYDPTNVLSTQVSKTNNIHFSDKEISKRNQCHIDEAKKFLEKACCSLGESDFPSAVEHSRQAVLHSGMVAVEKSRSIMSHHRRIDKYRSSFQALGCQDMFERFLKTLRLNKVDGKTSRVYDKLIQHLFDNGYPWIHRNLEEKTAPQWMDWTKKISLHSVLNWRILPIYKIGHRHADFVDKVIDEYEEFAKAVFEVNNQKYEEVTLIFRELQRLEDQPPNFSEMFQEALRANSLTFNRTQRSINRSADFVECVIDTIYS